MHGPVALLPSASRGKQVRDPQNPCSAGADLVLPSRGSHNRVSKSTFCLAFHMFQFHGAVRFSVILLRKQGSQVDKWLSVAFKGLPFKSFPGLEWKVQAMTSPLFAPPQRPLECARRWCPSIVWTELSGQNRNFRGSHSSLTTRCSLSSDGGSGSKSRDDLCLPVYWRNGLLCGCKCVLGVVWTAIFNTAVSLNEN